MALKMIEFNRILEPKDTTWPANDVFLNPIVELEKRNERWEAAYQSLEKAVRTVCERVRKARGLGRIALSIRLGAVPESDESLVIAASGHTPFEATDAAREILEQLPKVKLPSIN